MDKKVLTQQTNDSPEPLRSYLHGIETSGMADIVWQNEQLRQELADLRATRPASTVDALVQALEEAEVLLEALNDKGCAPARKIWLMCNKAHAALALAKGD